MPTNSYKVSNELSKSRKNSGEDDTNHSSGQSSSEEKEKKITKDLKDEVIKEVVEDVAEVVDEHVPLQKASKKSKDVDGAARPNGILKKKKVIVEDVPKKEKWQENYVPVCDLNDNDVVNSKSKKTKIDVVEKSAKPKESSRSAAKDENMVRKVSEIFEEVFQEQRGHWRWPIEYFLSCLGMPIAFSSLWRFPFLISKYGGGAFLFCYVLLLLIVGMPLFFMESILGQFAQLSCIHVWRCAPLMQGVGVAMIVLSLITSIYNSQIIAYAVHYFFASFVNTNGMVLWAECKSSWLNCYNSKLGSECTKNGTIFETEECFSSSRLYWQENVLRVTELGDIGRTGAIHWDLALCLAFVWLAVLAVLFTGIESFGKFAFFSATIPICVLVSLLVGTLQMDPTGAIEGLVTFYSPEWDRLSDCEIWQRAIEQVLFSLSIAYGSVITLGSYKKIQNTAESAPVILVIFNLMLSVLASTTVFAMLGALANAFQIEDVKYLMQSDISNIELLFTRLPEAIAVILPIPHAWSVFFFLMLLLFGIHSQAALIESICTTVYDAMPKMRKKKFIVVGCLVLPLLLFSLSFSSSTGIHIHRLLENSIIGPNIVLLVIIELIALQFFYGVRRFSNDCSLIMKKQISIYWKVCWIFITPLTLVVLLVFASLDWKRNLFEDRRKDKDWALYLSWTLSLLPLAMIPLTLIFTFFYKLCKKEPLTQPSYLWGPGCPKLREKLAEKAQQSITGEENEAYNRN